MQTLRNCFSCDKCWKIVERTVVCSNSYSSRVTSQSTGDLQLNVKSRLKKALNEAKGIVNYSSIFSNLIGLVDSNVYKSSDNQMLLQTAKKLFSDVKDQMHDWGLIVLLVSKATSNSLYFPETKENEVSGVLQSQRDLSEIAEKIQLGHMIHQGVVNTKHSVTKETSDYNNKVSILCGDSLLGNACMELAKLRNQDVYLLMSSAGRDLAECNFVGIRDSHNVPLPSKPLACLAQKYVVHRHSDDIDNKESIIIADAMSNPMLEWELRTTLNGGSFLGKSCQSALILANRSTSLQKKAYFFGKHLAMAWQASIELKPFQTTYLPPKSKFSLVSAPVLFHLESNPELYDEIEKGLDFVENIDFQKIHSEIMKGSAVSRTEKLQAMHSQQAHVFLRALPPSESRAALREILHSFNVKKA